MEENDGGSRGQRKMKRKRKRDGKILIEEKRIDGNGWVGGEAGEGHEKQKQVAERQFENVKKEFLGGIFGKREGRKEGREKKDSR